MGLVTWCYLVPGESARGREAMESPEGWSIFPIP